MDLSVDGRRTFAATGGRTPREPDPTVVFIHGAGMDHTVWTLQTRFFAHHGRNVLALDLPGHGRSAGAPCETIDAYAEWLLRAMDVAKLDRAALVGHSMGALIALAAAAAAPARIWALALLGVAPEMPVHPDLLRDARAGRQGATDLVASWGFGRRAHIGGARAPGLWMLGQGVRLLEKGSAGALAADLDACAAYRGARDAAGMVRCPTVIVAGALDRMTPPRGASELAGLIDGARVVQIEGCGHMMMVEQPDRTLDVLTEVA